MYRDILWSTTLIQTELSQQLLDGLSLKLMPHSMNPYFLNNPFFFSHEITCIY